MPGQIEGDLTITDSSNREVLRFDADNAILHIGADGNEGRHPCSRWLG